MKPIQRLFKMAQAAVCLANEWRDTLMATAGAVYLGVQLSNGNVHAGVQALKAVVIRESVRSLLWYCSKHRHFQIAGISSKEINLDKNSAASALVSSAALIGWGASSLASAADPLVGAVVITFGLGAARLDYSLLRGNGGRVRDIPQMYFDPKAGMWDWPRRGKDGGGTTQTQKIKDGFSELKERAFGWTRRPVRVTVRISKSALNSAATPRV